MRNTMETEELREAVLTLPEKERARLAQELLRSLDGPTDPDVDAAWLSEIERRARVRGVDTRELEAGINRETMPLHIAAAWEDAESAAEHERQERCLFYVATTRARDELVVTRFEERSPFL